ncbi:MAG TPA: DEAD/DEAH box helicase, partial [archaeon]|nr:DEAD/DEAH box helicase [archaeon]
MKIDQVGEKYPVLKKVVDRIKEVDKVDDLFPPQADAINSGYLDGKNMVLAIPTSCGKTLVSELAMLKTILEIGKKAVYIVPLKALASEKYEEFKNKYEPFGIKVAISVGDMDSTDPWLSRMDIIVITSEKLDSLLRHGIDWLNNIGLVVVDEIHLLDSPNRGPTLEIVITRLMETAKPKILGLSATISNYKELAKWLGAISVKSDFRPVSLYKGICYDGSLTFNPKTEYIFNQESEEPVFELIDKKLDLNKQSLVFVSTRKSAESTAEKIGAHIVHRLSQEDKTKLEDASRQILHSLDRPTSQCEKLAACIRNGVAFHHAGAVSKQRGLVEKHFKDGLIKVITATPTLAWGVNIPAHQVIIRDLKRFAQFKGMDYLPVLDIQQMQGRAGRVKYDTEGYSILLPKNEVEARYAWDNYINGEPEKIYSKLGVEPVLRTHVLALIASQVVSTKQDLFNFFSKTFYSFQYQDSQGLQQKLERVLKLLEKFNFITTTGAQIENNNPFRKASELKPNVELKPTTIGKRVSELYIDPLTANYIIESLKKSSGLTPFSILHTVCRCLEAKPLISTKKKDMEYIEEILSVEGSNLVDKPPNEWDIDYEDYVDSIKTASFFMGWVEEFGEDKILEVFGVTPGELRARLDIADWLLYSISELALLLSFMDKLKDVKKVRVRVEYGIKEELLTL